MTTSQRTAVEAQPLTVEECKSILGDSVAGKSDEQIAKMLDELEQVASVMYDDLITEAQKDIDRVRWSAYAAQHPEDAS
jgi:hypothetical protein